MNGSWSSWNPDNAAQSGLAETPSTYVAMWQHVVNYFRNAGVTNVKWVWAPNVDDGTGTMAAYYPGDGYVDDVGLDGYNNAYSQNGSWLAPTRCSDRATPNWKASRAGRSSSPRPRQLKRTVQRRPLVRAKLNGWSN